MIILNWTYEQKNNGVSNCININPTANRNIQNNLKTKISPDPVSMAAVDKKSWFFFQILQFFLDYNVHTEKKNYLGNFVFVVKARELFIFQWLHF